MLQSSMRLYVFGLMHNKSVFTMSAATKHRVALVCDFFYPRLGGVEMHIWSLAQKLVQKGHKVIIITHGYPGPKLDNGVKKSRRIGVRYLPGPIKVYYCPLMEMVDGDIFPTFSVSLPLFRHILIREKIEIVHGHQATSVMTLEACMYATTLGLASVYTDHSLFGFEDIASLHLNKVLKIMLATVDASVCVSHACRDNLILRAALDPTAVHVVPNAVEADKFVPNPSQRSKDRIKVVVVSRLVYRKGVDLLVGIIKPICKKFPNVDFIIGGDGAKKLVLEEMAEREQLQDRIEFLGAVPHSKVRDVLIKGNVFLNCSLTESFCIAILEAACSGLFVVSTNVGGVPEVLPPDMINLAEPEVGSLIESLSDAIQNKIDTADPFLFHDRISSMYSWDHVANKTVLIYDKVRNMPRLSLIHRLERYMTAGIVSGYVGCLVAVTVQIIFNIIDWWIPKESIDIVPDLIGNEAAPSKPYFTGTKKKESYLIQT